MRLPGDPRSWPYALDRGLVGEWRFDRNTGLIVPDHSGYALHGIASGDPAWVATRYGPALEIDSTDTVKSPASFEDLIINYAAGTWEFFGSIDDVSGDWGLNGLFGWRATSENQTKFCGLVHQDGAGRLYLQVGAGDTWASIYTNDFSAGNIEHYVGTYDGANIRLYVNADLKAGPSAQTGNLDDYPFGDLTLQLAGYGTPYVANTVLLARFYNRALSAAEVRRRCEICTARASGAASVWMIPFITAPSPVLKSVSDSGSGGGVVGIEAAVPAGDAGVGTGQVGVESHVPASDVGVGAALVGIEAAVPAGDAGVGIGQVGIESHVPTGDAGVGVGQVGIEAAVPTGDAGVGAGQVGIESHVPTGDAGVGAGQVGIEAAVPAGDAGVGVGQVGIEAAVPAGDAGVGAALVGVESQVPTTDDGTGSESVSVTQTVPIAVEDAGFGVDVVVVGAWVSISETGAGGGAAQVQVQTTIADAATGAEIAQVQANIVLTEPGSGTGAIVTSASVSVPETSQASELPAIHVEIPLSDVGDGIDAALIQQFLALLDSGAGQADVAIDVTALVRALGPVLRAAVAVVGDLRRLETPPAPDVRDASDMGAGIEEAKEL